MENYDIKKLRAKFWCDTVLHLMRENPNAPIGHLTQKADQLLGELNSRFFPAMDFTAVRNSVDPEKHVKSVDAPDFPLDDSAKWVETKDTRNGSPVTLIGWQNYTIVIDDKIHTLTRGGVLLRVLKRATGVLSTGLVQDLKTIARYDYEARKKD